MVISARFLNIAPYPQTHESARPKRKSLKWTPPQKPARVDSALVSGGLRSSRPRAALQIKCQRRSYAPALDVIRRSRMVRGTRGLRIEGWREDFDLRGGGSRWTAGLDGACALLSHA